jgi:hypothetical protein
VLGSAIWKCFDNFVSVFWASGPLGAPICDLELVRQSRCYCLGIGFAGRRDLRFGIGLEITVFIL